jgi:transposase-like protein
MLLANNSRRYAMSLDRLAAKVAAIPLNTRGRRRYTAALRKEIMTALAASGLSHQAFAEKIGVSGAEIVARPRRLLHEKTLGWAHRLP